MDRRTALQTLGGGAALAFGGMPVAAWAASGLAAVDRLAIQDVLHQWVWAMDTGDAAALVRTMTPDARVVDRRGRAPRTRAAARWRAGSARAGAG